jgi:CRISPR-associated RAMP protein, Cmr6 family
LEAVRRAAERVDKQLLREWNTRWQACARAANGEPFGLTTDWRLIAGLGRKGSLEVGFTFHRYGFPILPGSSVKGVARAWALLQIAEKVGTTELKELDGILSADGDKEREKYEDWKAGQPAEVQKLADDFRTIFGTTAAAGRAVFFDAIPASLPTLELDIMNPHYPKYYGGEEPPTDWQSPVPVYFLTVAANTEFCFAVGWRGTLDDEGRRLRDQAQQWLKDGLTQLGAGAKTSAGYGYFLPPQPSQPAGAVSQPAATTQALQPAPTSPTPALPATPVPSEELVWRTGTVREYRPDKRAGRLVDDETGEELPFHQEAIEEKGWSPGKKHKVRYAVVEREGRRVVVKVQRA